VAEGASAGSTHWRPIQYFVIPAKAGIQVNRSDDQWKCQEFCQSTEIFAAILDPCLRGDDVDIQLQPSQITNQIRPKPNLTKPQTAVHDPARTL
jgi:hypothetical protein